MADYIDILNAQVSKTAAARGRTRGQPNTTPEVRRILVDFWAREVRKAQEAGVRGIGNTELFRAFLASGAPALTESGVLTDAEFWQSLTRTAVALNVEPTIPSGWELLEESLDEVLQERAEELEEAGEAAKRAVRSGFGFLWLAAPVALIGAGASYILKRRTRQKVIST